MGRSGLGHSSTGDTSELHAKGQDPIDKELQILKELDLHEGDHIVLKGHQKPNEGTVLRIDTDGPHAPKIIFQNEKHHERPVNPSQVEKVVEE